MAGKARGGRSLASWLSGMLKHPSSTAPESPGAAPGSKGHPPFRRGLRSRLGIRLEAAHRPVDFLIDRISRPTGH